MTCTYESIFAISVIRLMQENSLSTEAADVGITLDTLNNFSILGNLSTFAESLLITYKAIVAVIFFSNIFLDSSILSCLKKFLAFVPFFRLKVI